MMEKHTVGSVSRIFLAFPLMLMLGACAIGHKYDYSSTTAELNAETDKTVSASVIENRTYVINGEKDPNFVGLQRGGFGNPFDVTTRSGRPFATELTEALVKALDTRGIQAQTLILAPRTTDAEAVAAFQDQDTDRLLLIRMREWKTDSVMRFRVIWKLKATVYDRTGALLAENTVQGDGVSGSAGLESANNAIALRAMSSQLEHLLNSREMIAALL